MIEKLIAVRKHGGEKYKIFVMLPEYDGETGIFGMELFGELSARLNKN